MELPDQDYSTREKLILTAERLFAEYGLDGVTFKQITEQAGQRNVSALQYYFGSKRDLVRAIVAYRMTDINRRRTEILDRLEAEGRSDNLRSLVEAMVYPLADQLYRKSASRHYVRFLAQAWRNPTGDLHNAVTAELNSSVIRVGLLAGSLMQNMPEEIRDQRLAMLPGTVVHALADFDTFISGRAPTADKPDEEVRLFAASLVDVVVATLSAPASDDTRSALDRSRAIGRSRR